MTRKELMELYNYTIEHTVKCPKCKLKLELDNDNGINIYIGISSNNGSDTLCGIIYNCKKCDISWKYNNKGGKEFFKNELSKTENTKTA